MDQYRIIRPLGEGTYGQVHEAEDKRSLTTVAIKVLHNSAQHDRGVNSQEECREMTALQLCQHPNVVRLHGHFVHQHALALVLDHMHCDLAHLLSQCQRTATPLPLHVTRLIAQQLLTAIAHIHSLGVLHRDIKPSNILLAASGQQAEQRVRLTDFGQASIRSPASDRPLSPAVSTRWYKAPELLLPASDSGAEAYGSGVDVWAAGCVLAECISGAPLLAGMSDVEQLSRIAAMCGRQGGELGWEAVEAGCGARALLDEGQHITDAENERMWCDALNMLESMLEWDPARRIAAKQALLHPFFTRKALVSDNESVASLDALLNKFDLEMSRQTKASVATTELLQRPLTIRDIFPDASAVHQVGQTAIM